MLQWIVQQFRLAALYDINLQLAGMTSSGVTGPAVSGRLS